MAATRLSFSYPEKMRDKLQTLAKKDGRSLSSYVQRILTKHLSNVPISKTIKKKRVKRKN